MLNSILVELNREEAGCIVGILDGIKVNPKLAKVTKEPSIAGEIATYVTVQEGVDKIKEALYVLETPQANRNYSFGKIEVDSGWDRNGASIGLSSRGSTMFNRAEWLRLAEEVEKIFAWCDFKFRENSQREEQERERKEKF